jgi:fructose-1,6-bisphosphatase II
VTALGGLIQGILMPRDEQEKQKGIVSGLKMDYVYEAHELVRSDNTFFIATGVTDGQLLEGVRRKGPMIRTESVIIRGRSGTIRRIIAEHQASRWS